MTLCEVRVSPNHSIVPNVGVTELADAINKSIPFASKDSEKPIMSAVFFNASEGKLALVATDGVILSETTLDYEGSGQALIGVDELRGVASALRKAKRARVSFEGEDTKTLLVETDIIRYKFVALAGTYPDYKRLIPTEQNCQVHFDSVEALGSVKALQALVGDKDASIDLNFAEGVISFANPDGQGTTRMSADIVGEGYIRVNSTCLLTALKAMGGMVTLALSSPTTPCLLSLDGHRVIIMPMMSEKAKADTEAKKKAEKAELEPTEQAEPVAEKKTKRNRKKEKVAVTT
jgi:DNA polymerase III sliding clamp (beta) subunit (PCNA family)